MIKHVYKPKCLNCKIKELDDNSSHLRMRLEQLEGESENVKKDLNASKEQMEVGVYLTVVAITAVIPAHAIHRVKLFCDFTSKAERNQRYI